jgi:RNase P protein component
MREALRAIEKKKEMKVGFLIVIAARSALLNLKSTDAERQLDSAFKKLGMYKEL